VKAEGSKCDKENWEQKKGMRVTIRFRLASQRTYGANER
jgi:hypothetical protein